jgi:hypothetical protein
MQSREFVTYGVDNGKRDQNGARKENIEFFKQTVINTSIRQGQEGQLT